MPQHPDPQQLLQAFVEFVQATSWPQSMSVLEQHPELLGDEVDALLGQLAAAQESKEAHDLVEAHRALLAAHQGSRRMTLTEGSMQMLGSRPIRARLIVVETHFEWLSRSVLSAAWGRVAPSARVQVLGVNTA